VAREAALIHKRNPDDIYILWIPERSKDIRILGDWSVRSTAMAKSNPLHKRCQMSNQLGRVLLHPPDDEGSKSVAQKEDAHVAQGNL
jgi:hypothetical protein